MSRKKMCRADRKLLKRHGFGKQFGAQGEFLVATHHAQVDARAEGYAVRADIEHGKRTRRRVRRERWNRRWRCLRRFALMVAVYGGSLAVTVVLWHYLLEFVGWLCRD